MFFRKTMAAVLTFSLVLGWSPTSYRAYADSPALDENSSAKIFEQNNPTGGGSSEQSDAQASPVFDFQAAVDFAAADAALCSYPDDELDISLLTNLGDQAVDSDANIAPLDDIQEESAPHDETVQGDAAANDEAASGQDAAVSGETSDAQQDAAEIEGAEVLQQGDGETGNVLLADRAAVDALGGRDYVGQTVKEINGTKYILIGNEQQLRAIGSDKHVLDKVFDWNGKEWVLDYSGDTELSKGQELKDKHYAEVGHCGAGPDGSIDKGSKANTGLKYSADANYIIFRDIDLNGLGADTSVSNWQPLTFSGEMIGAKAESGEALWDDASSAITATGRPVISNMRVFQNESLDVGETMGVGFFATLYGEAGETPGVLGSAGSAKVSGIVLQNATVQTNTSETHYDPSLINSLTKLLGGLVGGILDILLGLLGINIDLSKILTDLLDARKNDPTALATGVFAGRVVGEASVENCDVISSNVSSVNSLLGGFVGYTDGIVNYATEGLGSAVELLSNILNAIPGVGLGDLITVLLKNGLALGKLVPVGYIAPVFSGCHVSDLNSEEALLGVDSSRYVGGFVGLQIGTDIDNCTVSANRLTVRASSFGGAFVGLARDAEIKGLLSDVGIELIRFAPQSTIANSAVSVRKLDVVGGDYLGGFAGALANSYAVNDDMTANVSVTGSVRADGSTKGACVGGFAGTATTGWVTNLGVGQSQGDNLLGNVGGLLDGLLSSNPDQAHGLLSLAGVAPSGVLGCQVNGGTEAAGKVVKVVGESYAGGIIGKGDAVRLGASTSENLKKLPGWDADSPVVAERSASLSGLESVTARERYAGGVVGSLGAASVGGLLNGALGLASFLGFDVNGVSVSGAADACAVSARYYAGGAFGEAVGGDARAVNVKGVSSVEAQSYSGGFAGVVGPGDLASTGGLSLNLLGLDKLLKLDSLLSVVPGVRVSMNECTVEGVESGMAVVATGGESWAYAGGFASYCNSAELSGCRVSNLKSVIAPDATGSAGGFAGVSSVGDLADLAGEDGSLTVGGALIEAKKLLGTVGYLIPEYKDCTASYVKGGFVQADIAGGFAGELQSGKVDNSARVERDRFAVYNIDRVAGQSYAGGFGGIVRSGALADAGKGISILGGSGINIDVAGLVDLVQAYVPFVTSAGVKSDDGFVVQAKKTSDTDVHAGSAGGFAGYASGAQISGCDVTSLKKTNVVAPDDLEAQDAPSYFDGSSAYAVEGGRYAGGFIGCADVGSAASVGKGLGVLGSTLSLANILSALSAVVTTVEHSGVSGCAGGFSVLADARDSSGSALGCAGGFAGVIYGGHVQNSHVENFEYVIGQVAAGGFAGKMKPGDVASVVSDAGLLGNLVSVNEALASLLQAFVPTVRNSTAGCVPCGGAVRAQAFSGTGVMRGMAGGFVGCNRGGSIWGDSADSWKDVAEYAGPKSKCRIDRIRSVYGAEYAGGFTGVIEAANTAEVGSLNVLGGLIGLDNVLGALSTVYVTQRDTSVHGPLANLSVETWNKWVEFVGINGGFGADLAVNGKVDTPEQLANILDKYVYGCNIVAGRSSLAAGNAMSEGGVAGGYVGLMRSGVVEDSVTNDVKTVRAMCAAGGYAGLMESGGAVNLGGANILGLKLDLGQLLSAAEVFVPSIQGSSSTVGYREGMTVQALGMGSAENDEKYDLGHAGGYVGYAEGAQVWGDTKGATGCNVGNLRLVKGTNTVGGYAGTAAPGSATDANTNASNGLLQGILDFVIKQPGDVANVLEATMTTIRGASVTPADEAWGFVVDGSHQNAGATEFATAAGGFVGSCESAVLGSKEGASKLSVSGLRGVSGGKNAGGFVGLADVGSVADVGGTDAGTNKTSILADLIGLGNVSVLDAFRSYVYHASVTGVADGAQVRANTADKVGIMDSLRYFGNAGGFAGSLLNGSVKDCTVSALSMVTAPSYAGGFAGYMGKNSTVDVDEAGVGIGEIFKLLNLQAGVLDVWGSHADRCRVEGIASGFTVTSGADAGQDIVEQGNDAAKNIAGGFVGLGDLSKIDACEVSNLGIVRSDQVAAGFIGQTDMSFIANTEVDSVVVELLLVIVDQLVRALHGDKLQNIDLANFSIPGLDKLLNLKILSDGGLLYVNLLGLRIGVALAKPDPNNPTQSDAVIVTIGDSTIKLPCNKDGVIRDDKTEANLKITLIKGNRTAVTNSKVTGAYAGYDVFGGGATQDADGAAVEGGLPADKNQRPDNAGYAGGFVGHNKEGLFEGNEMVYCDVVRGTERLVGPFSGMTNLQSVYFKDADTIEGKDNEGRYNLYSIYRDMNAALTDAVAKADGIFSHAQQDTASGTDYNRYEVQHYEKISSFDELQGAVMQGDGTAPVAMEAYVSPAKAVLMDDALNTPGTGGITPEPGEGQDPCSALVDITLQKVWKDNANAGNTRPDEVTFKLKRTYTNAASVVVEDPTFGTNGVLEVKLTAADASEWSETWRKVLTGLPVAFEDTTVDPSVVRYYTYSVTEVRVGAYDATTNYSYTVPDNETRYVITVTNTLPLPETGGMGVWPLVMLALALMAGGALWYRRRRAAQAACEAFGFGAAAQGVVVPGGASGKPVVLNLPRI